jgi:hypothetical protein
METVRQPGSAVLAYGDAFDGIAWLGVDGLVSGDGPGDTGGGLGRCGWGRLPSVKF